MRWRGRSWGRGAAAGLLLGCLLLLPAGRGLVPFGPGPVELAAQELVTPDDGSALLGGGGLVVQSLRFGDEAAVGLRSLSLVTVPIALGTPRRHRFGAELHGGWARGSMTRADGSDVELSGPVDTRLQLRADVLPDRLTLTGTAVLPTGVESHSPDELELAGVIAADLVPFRISHWSGGGGVGLSAASFHSFGATAVGVDAGYHHAMEFEPMAGDGGAYRPGHAVHLGVAMDHAVQQHAKVTVRADVRRHGDDELDGQRLFRTGSRVGATAAYSFASGVASSGIAYLGYRHRGEGTFLVDLERRPSQNVLLAGGGLRMPWRGGVLTPSVDLRVLRRADGTGQGYTGSVGAGGEWARGGVTLLPAARVRLGSVVVRDGIDSGFWGLDLSLQLRRGNGS